MHEFSIELENCSLRISLKVRNALEVNIRKPIALATKKFRQRIPNVHKARFEQRAFYGSNDCSMHACHYQLAPLFNYPNCNQTMAMNRHCFRPCEFVESSFGNRRTKRVENNLMTAGSTVYSRKVCFICLVNSLEIVSRLCLSGRSIKIRSCLTNKP